MSFLSILGESDHLQLETANQPDFFPDLNLDEIVDNITKPKQEYKLKPFFWPPLNDVKTIRYRQEVMRDLENQTVMNHIKTFSAKMSSVRRYLGMANKLDHDHHRKGWILEAALVYCEAVMNLNDHLANTSLGSRGLFAFDELASMTAKAVSMVAMVDMDDPTIRTFKVVRRPANGLAYALSLVQKYGLTYEQIME